MKRKIVGEEDTSSDEEEIAAKPKKKPPKRRLVYCPIPECASAPLKKVSQHLRQYHQLVDADVQRLLRNKRYATQNEIKQKKKKNVESGFGDLRKMFSSQGEVREGVVRASSSFKEKELASVSNKGKGRESKEGGGRFTSPERRRMRDMEQHMHDPFLDEFFEYLTSRSGGKKSFRNARSIKTNVSKYLFWCKEGEVDTSFLTKSKRIKKYIEEMECKGLGPSALQQKISDIETSLRFLMSSREDEKDESALNTLALANIKKLRDLRLSFKGEKARKERESLEDLAANLPSTSNINKFLESTILTKIFEDCCSRLKKNPQKADYNRALAIIGGRLLYR